MSSESKQINEIFSDYSLDDVEIVIQKLKEAGFSQIETVKIIRKEFEIGLSEADHCVLHSVAWKDDLQKNVKLRDDLFDHLT